MELYIGGYGQGKLEYVLKSSGCDRKNVVSKPQQILKYEQNETVIFYQFHKWFYEEIQKGNAPEEAMKEVINHYEKIIIICNEVGNGIVPMNLADRQYRDRLGAYLCHMAQRAERVERIICQMGQRLK